jgi:cytochrome d ubiquinol oxidase subunit I
MHYPWWYVPVATGPMLIALIATLHVLVAHYAVGGGFFLAVETSFAYRTGNQAYLAYLRRHAQFFILLTVVFGAITGVGIWWTIGLASPLATQVLIQTFVFGWAMEWVFFVLEITSAFGFFYFWGRLPPGVHRAFGWIYAWAAWISLVLITGITGFMLHPGRWLEPGHRSFWIAFFNPQLVPQVVARTGGALLLSSLYVYLHAAWALRQEVGLRELVARRSARPALLGAALLLVGGGLWAALLPESARALLPAAAALNILLALAVAISALVVVLVYLGPMKNPGWLSVGFAGTLWLLGMAGFSVGEFIREAVRKPYIIYNVVFGHQVFPEQVVRMREQGFLESGLWTRAWMAAHYPQVFVSDGTATLQASVSPSAVASQDGLALTAFSSTFLSSSAPGAAPADRTSPAGPEGRLSMVGPGGRIDEARLLQLPQADQVQIGRVLFMYHCNDCHAERDGYSAAGRLLQGRPKPRMVELVRHLHEHRFAMPPWSGSEEEAQVLAEYLATITPPRPAGMSPELGAPGR